MDMEYQEIHSENFDEIVEDIKQRNLSRNNMPKIIVGTGLSVIYGVPGMKELAEHLAKEIAQSSDEQLKEIWKNHCDEIEANGLEAGLANLAQNENDLVDAIKPITAKTICNDLQFVASWIYLYTMNWKKTMVTGITAYKRRSPNVL